VINQISRKPAFYIFAIIFLFTALNSIFNTLLYSLGYGYPYTTFLFDPADRLADYFKVIFSFPEAANLQIEVTSGFSELLNNYLHNNPYKGIAAASSGQLSNLHAPPIGTLIGLLNLKLMHYVNPVTLFLSILLVGFSLAYKFVASISVSKSDLLFLFLSLLFCYPSLFMLTRGHIYSGISSLSLLIFIVLMFQDRKKYLGLILLAIAVNLRPNAVVFLFALGICDSRNLRKDIPIFIGFTTFIFLTSLFFANRIYPDYTLSNFLSGVSIYHDIYVIGNAGLAFGSSLFGPLKAIFGYSKVIEVLPIVIAGLMVAIGTLQLRNNTISKIAFLFILCSSYVLGSAVIADYHLTVFFAPLLCIYLEQRKGLFNSLSPPLSKELLIVFFASVFLLCPKNYIFIKFISGQVALNPLVLLIACILIIRLSVLKSSYNQLSK
jgi:hypothetical protein